jgi:hypothetical protein
VQSIAQLAVYRPELYAAIRDILHAADVELEFDPHEIWGDLIDAASGNPDAAVWLGIDRDQGLVGLLAGAISRTRHAVFAICTWAWARTQSSAVGASDVAQASHDAMEAWARAQGATYLLCARRTSTAVFERYLRRYGYSPDTQLYRKPLTVRTRAVVEATHGRQRRRKRAHSGGLRPDPEDPAAAKDAG